MDTMVAHGVPNKLRALKLGINLLKPPSQSVSQSVRSRERDEDKAGGAI